MDKRFQTGCPLVHCITNYVAMEFTANAILAVGARPLMSFSSDEMEEIVSKCDSLLVNIGCIDIQQKEAAMKAVSAAGKYGKPWVLDPVGIQLTKLRFDTCKELIAQNPPAVIKSNSEEAVVISEILDNSSSAKDVVLITTGETDVISQGDRTARVAYGNPIMKKVTAMGCAAGGILAAYLAKCEDAFQASVDAMTLFGRAGEKAAEKSNNGTGTFKTLFLDELRRLS